MTEQQSQTVTATGSTSFTRVASDSCMASCTESVGPVYMFQWVLSVGKNCVDGRCPTYIHTCIFLCKTTPALPKCIPSECADKECNTCVESFV